MELFSKGPSKDSYYVYEPAYKNFKPEKIFKMTGKIKDILAHDIELHKNSTHK